MKFGSKILIFAADGEIKISLVDSESEKDSKNLFSRGSLTLKRSAVTRETGSETLSRGTKIKTVGIIGGLGPETTTKFIQDIIKKFCEINKEERPPILSWNVPINLKIEEDLIKKSFGEGRFLPFLTDAAKRLERGGADFLVIPCNTVHIFIGEIRSSVGIPVLSIIEESAKHLKKLGVKKVAVLATGKSIEKNIHKEVFEKFGIETFLPSATNREKINFTVSRILHSEINENDKNEMRKIIEGFKKRGIKDILLACTDLHQAIGFEDSEIKIHDTLNILSSSAVREMKNLNGGDINELAMRSWTRIPSNAG